MEICLRKDLEMPEVSVIIPVHNREGLISRAIQSVLDQTFQDFELIVVDDHSTDNTIGEVKQINNNHIRLLTHKQNKGAQAARNTGIQNSLGKWVTFLDSDDKYLENSLLLRMNCANEKKVEVVHSEGLVIDPGDQKPKLRRIPPMEGDVYKAILRRPGPAFPTLFVSRKALETIGPLDENLPAYQEWDTCIRLAKFYQFGFVAQPTFLYNRLGQISISKNAIKSAKGYIKIYQRYQKKIEQNCGRKALGPHCLRISYFLMRAGKKKEAMEWYRLAWRYNPWQIRLWIFFPVIVMGGSLQKLVERIRFDH
jgi:glycosyltransferase involved in cell wall biosynthesis